MCSSHSQSHYDSSLPLVPCSHDKGFLSIGVMVSHTAQGSEIYVRTLIETYDT